MLKKRLIGVVTVQNNWAVQSFGYKKYLPLGKPECLVENLDRWGVDEILVQVIDASCNQAGPDLHLLNQLAKRGFSTPLIYAGGIRSEADAVAVVRAGADRVCVDNLLYSHGNDLCNIADRLGAQAIIASLPLGLNSRGLPQCYDYVNKKFTQLEEKLQLWIQEGVISELLLIDFQHEGYPAAFDFRLLNFLPEQPISFILFGGLSQSEQINQALLNPRVKAVAVGNFLSYQEHAVQQLKQKLTSSPIRPPHYQHSFTDILE